MKCKIECDECGATGWGRGINEPDVNAFSVTDCPKEWEGGSPDCKHDGEFSILDAEDDDD